MLRRITMLEVVALVAVVTVSVGSYWAWSSLEYFTKGRKLPGPPTLPILGNLLDLYKKGRHVLDFLMSMVQKYKGFAALWQGTGLVVLLAKSEYSKVFHTLTERSDHYKTFTEFMGPNAVFASSGKTWQVARKQLMMSFSVMPLEQLFDNFEWASRSLLEQLGKVAHGHHVKAWLPLRVAVTHALLKNLLDMTQSNEELMKLIEDDIEVVQRIMWFRQFHPLERYDWFFHLMPVGRCYRKCLKRLNRFVSSLVSIKIQHFQMLKVSQQSIPNVWIYNLLDAYPERSENLLCEDLKTLLIAGMDTTSGVLGYALLMLGLHPDVQDRMYQEVVAVTSRSANGPNITYADLQHLEYTERVLRETLRLFPVGEIAGRKLHEDTYFGEHLVPKDADVVYFHIVAQRDPDIWKHPLTFDPDRFLPQNFAKIPPMAYIPFGYGRRSCPGSRYSMIAMKTMLAGIVLELRVGTSYKSVHDVADNAVADATLNDKLWFPCTFTKRNQEKETSCVDINLKQATL